MTGGEIVGMQRNSANSFAVVRDWWEEEPTKITPPFDINYHAAEAGDKSPKLTLAFAIIRHNHV